jgi:hypothetical protein
MIPFHHDLQTFLYLCQDGIRIAGELGIADVERSHVTMIPLLENGGLEMTRTSDLFRVKEAL